MRLWFRIIAAALVIAVAWPTPTIVRADSGVTWDKVTVEISPDPLERLTREGGVPPFQTTRIFDRHGQVIAEIADRGRRTVVSLEQIPQWAIYATLATEDKNFYHHNGVDTGAILRAAWQNLQSWDIVSGGSTIHQQVARLLLMDDANRQEQTLARKAREASLALDLNLRYSKEEVLELYLNSVYYGNQAYGIAAAAEVYFGKHVSELTLGESSLLAGLPQSPNYWDPFINVNGARSRQQTVLRLMYRAGYINVEELSGALLENVLPLERPGVPRQAPHFVDHVRSLLLERYGPEGMRQGLQVYTSIDLRFQEMAETIARAQIAELQDRHGVNNAALVALHPPTGEILAMVGSLDYWDPDIDGQVNVTLRLRQPGSAIKPILYATAFESGWTPASVIWDTATSFPLIGNLMYTPRNITGRYYGPLRLRAALANSLNIPAVKLLHEVGIERQLEIARQLGINSWREPVEHYGLSLALGGYEVTLLELTHAFSTLANTGAHVPLAPITEIRDSTGRVIFQSQPEQNVRQSISPVAAYQISNVLSDPRSRQMLFGQNSSLDTSRITAVKTGTTDNWRDNMIVGYTSYLAVGVWIGNSDNQPMRNATAFQTVGPIWHDIMEATWANPALYDSLGYANQPLPEDFEPPHTAVRAPVCEILPGVFNRSCPVAYEEIFEQSALAEAPNFTDASTEEADENLVGFCLPLLASDLHGAAMREAAFVPLPQNNRDANAARNWARNHGLALVSAGQCDWTVVTRPLAATPALPEPTRLIYIPEPVVEVAAEETGAVNPEAVSGTVVRLISSAQALHMRSGPGVGNSSLGYLLAGDEAVLREGAEQVGASVWYEIQNLRTGQIGWVNSNYLTE